MTESNNRWRLMLAALAGKPSPKLPALPGRVHRAPVPEAIDHRRLSLERALTLAALRGWRGWRP